MQDMYTVAINGVALHVDAEDAAFMQRYATAAAAIPDHPIKDNAEGIRQYCKSFRVFFDAKLRLVEAVQRYAPGEMV